MSILIRGMEMPKKCLDCPFMISRDNDDCILQSDEANAKFNSWDDMKASCPLVKIPIPHGRLGDLDALWDRMYKYIDNEGAKMPYGDNDFMIHKDSACELIEDMPTIIEAEGSKI